MREILDNLDYYIATEMPMNTPIEELRYNVAVELKNALYEIVISMEKKDD